jgi:MFS family permease
MTITTTPPTPPTPPTRATTAASIWAGRYGRTTVGAFALAFLFAFEALGVAAVMPEVAADLDGLRWYPVAFAAAMAGAVIALVVAAPAIDRHGPRPALTTGLLVFCAGVILAGSAPTMPVFLAGRLIFGLGAGVLGIALYLMIGQAYPEHLRARVFAVLTAGWVLPAMVGPIIATSVADSVGWRWVFLGVPAIAVGAWLLVRAAPSRPGPEQAGHVRWGAALLAAAGVLTVSAAGQRDIVAWPVLVIAGLVAVVLATRRLLPAGSWRGRAGLPSVLGSRAGIGTAFAAAEVYVPLLLTLHRGLTLAEAGWVLTTGAVTWCVGAWLAAHWRRLRHEPGRVRLGAGLLAAGIGGFATVSVPGMPLIVPLVAWGVAGLGIGMAFSTLSVLALAYAPAGEQARTSSALQLTDQLVGAGVLAVGSVVFAAFAVRAPVAGATLLVAAAAVVGLLALVPASRLAAPAPSTVD